MTDDVMASRIRRAQVVAVSGYMLLIVLTLGWEGWLSPTGRPGLWLTIKSLPLLVPLFGLLRGNLRSYIVASLLLLLYLTEGLVVVWTALSSRETDPLRGSLAGLEVILTILFVVCATYFVRWRRHQGATLKH